MMMTIQYFKKGSRINNMLYLKYQDIDGLFQSTIYHQKQLKKFMTNSAYVLKLKLRILHNFDCNCIFQL